MITKLNLDKEIKFIGFIDGKEKNILLSESYFLVLPSLSENFGNVIIESMAQSTPVITSKGTPWEIINKYNAGYYIDNSIDRWIKTIKKTILLNKDEYIKMRRNSYRLIDKKFNIQYNIKNWVSAYGKILNEK